MGSLCGSVRYTSYISLYICVLLIIIYVAMQSTIIAKCIFIIFPLLFKREGRHYCNMKCIKDEFVSLRQSQVNSISTHMLKYPGCVHYVHTPCRAQHLNT